MLSTTYLACSAANSFTQKMYNWNTLNAKVFHKLGFAVPKSLCEAAARAQPMAVEKVLKLIRFRFAELMQCSQQAEQVCAHILHMLIGTDVREWFGITPMPNYCPHSPLTVPPNVIRSESCAWWLCEAAQVKTTSVPSHLVFSGQCETLPCFVALWFHAVGSQ